VLKSWWNGKRGESVGGGGGRARTAACRPEHRAVAATRARAAAALGLDLPRGTLMVSATDGVREHFEVLRTRWSLFDDCPDLRPVSGRTSVLVECDAPAWVWSPGLGVAPWSAVSSVERWGVHVRWRPIVGERGPNGATGWSRTRAPGRWEVTATLALPSVWSTTRELTPVASWVFCVSRRGEVVRGTGAAVVQVGRTLAADQHADGMRLVLPVLVVLARVNAEAATLEWTGVAEDDVDARIVPLQAGRHPEDR